MDTTADAARNDATGVVAFCKRIVDNSPLFDSVGDCVSAVRSASRWAELCRDNADSPFFPWDSVGDCVSARQANGGNSGD